MMPQERKIRFDIALEMVQRVYTDYCRDPNTTKDSTYDFCCLVREMVTFADVLKKEVHTATQDKN